MIKISKSRKRVGCVLRQFVPLYEIFFTYFLKNRIGIFEIVLHVPKSTSASNLFGDGNQSCEKKKHKFSRQNFENESTKRISIPYKFFRVTCPNWEFQAWEKSNKVKFFSQIWIIFHLKYVWVSQKHTYKVSARSDG